MNKAFKAITAAFMSCVMLTSCAGKTAESGSSETSDSSSVAEQTVITPPFWVVEDAKTGSTLYLLGSMHVGKPNTVYPDYIMNAYEACDTVAAELDTVAANEDIQAAMDAAELLLCPDGKSAEDFFGDEYDEVVEFFTEKGLYYSMMDMYIPYYWASLLSVQIASDAGLDANSGTEPYFLGKAHEDGKAIVEIESMLEQYQMMADIPMDIQVSSVTECIGDTNYLLQQGSMQVLYDAWSTFDEEMLESLNASTTVAVPEGSEESYEQYFDLMYFDRQKKMGEAAVEFLQSGEDVFMFVGAAHFYIEEDILTYIENAGYTIEAVNGEMDAAAA